MSKAAISIVLLLLAVSTAQEPAAPSQSVITTMCQVCNDSSESTGCQTYTTPLNTCYNAQTLFPDDPSWSAFDIFDTISMKSMKRTFYKSGDGSCSNVVKVQEVLETVENRGFYYDNLATQEDDYFILPFDECVGPFGPPRPWGKFTLVDEETMSEQLGDYDEIVAQKWSHRRCRYWDTCKPPFCLGAFFIYVVCFRGGMQACVGCSVIDKMYQRDLQ